MNSRLIYSAIKSIEHKIIWDNAPHNEWVYIGEGNEINEKIIYQKIEELFGDEALLLVLGRENSKEIGKAEWQIEIIKRIGKINFLISHEKFREFIEFHKIGIMRTGIINKTNKK